MGKGREQNKDGEREQGQRREWGGERNLLQRKNKERFGENKESKKKKKKEEQADRDRKEERKKKHGIKVKLRCVKKGGVGNGGKGKGDKKVAKKVPMRKERKS